MTFPSGDDLIQPWEWNLPLELVVWLIVFMLVGGIGLWARSGAYRKFLPDILGRNVEDFAGISQEGNGPVPIFLFALYVVVATSIISYIIITLVFGYNY
ncbi:MAG: hypothetical protein ACJ78Q_08425 [Chloroflexia bacterium]